MGELFSSLKNLNKLLTKIGKPLKVLLGIVFVAFIGAAASVILKPKIVYYEGKDQNIVVEMLDYNFNREGACELMHKIKFKLINHSPVSGYLEKVEIRIGNLTNRSILTEVVSIDRKKLYFLQKEDVEVIFKLQIPISTFREKKPALFYCTFWDNEGQVIMEKLDFQVSTISLPTTSPLHNNQQGDKPKRE